MNHGRIEMYGDQWKSLSSRIHGPVQAGQLHAGIPVDSFERAGRLREKGEGVLAELRSFRARFEHALPPKALEAIDKFVKTGGDLLSFGTTSAVAGPELRAESVPSALVLLSDFESEMSFILSDVQWPIRALADR